MATREEQRRTLDELLTTPCFFFFTPGLLSSVVLVLAAARVRGLGPSVFERNVANGCPHFSKVVPRTFVGGLTLFTFLYL